jgi:hypothetical protein
MRNTSVNLDTTILKRAKRAYPGLSQSSIIRMALAYLVAKRPFKATWSDKEKG